MKKNVLGTMAVVAATSLAIAAPAFAQSNYQPGNSQGNAPGGMQRPSGSRGGMGMMKPGVVGSVTTVSGNTITLLGRSGFGKTATATTTYSVDASNAKVTKNNATSTVGDIAVGDTLFVQGTITGTNVAATMIRDGVMMGGPGKTGSSTPAQPAFTGNGEPIIAGTISAINGSTITITNKSNVTYSVDASNAKILQGATTVNVSTLKTGDTILVQGAVNGNSIVATSVIDQNKPAGSGSSNPHPGFLGGLGQFFMHLFGF